MRRELEPELMDTAAEAAAYDAMDHRTPNAAFVDRLIKLLDLSGFLEKARKSDGQPNAVLRVLDLGSGNGLIPLMLVDRLPNIDVLGIDLARHMLDVAERHRAGSPHGDRLRFEVADVKALPYDDASFDVVISNTILHHIPEPRALMREAWRVLRPGGVMLIRDLFRPADEQGVEQIVQEHAGDEPADAQQLLRQSLKAALTPTELRAIVDDLGWANVEVTVDSDRHVSVQTVAK